MNIIIEENNIKYIWFMVVERNTIFFEKFSKNIEKIGNIFIEYSKKILKDINE